MAQRAQQSGHRAMVNETRPMVLAKGHSARWPLTSSVLLEVLEALKAAEVDERIRQAAQTIYQALIEADLTSVIGAAPNQRTPDRRAHRNGHRPRVLATTAGDLERGSQAARGVVSPQLVGTSSAGGPGAVRGGDGGYLHGVSTRKVDDLVRALGADSGTSKIAT
jgi:putative transposase